VNDCPTCGAELAIRAKFCPECGAPLAANPAPQRQVRKTVTVLFSDLAGSTAIGERLDPELLRALMARYFDTMRAVIERHGGTVEKFIGDAIMAIFGIPVLHEDDALRAVRAAEEMREALAALNTELADEGGIEIRVRTGVNQRLNRGGDRQANSALYMLALSRLSRDPRTQAYVRRRTAEGKTKPEIMHCLKRYLTREVYRLLVPVPG